MFTLKKGILVSQIVILCLLGLAIAFVAIPSYVNKQWSWSELPEIPEIAQMRKVPEGIKRKEIFEEKEFKRRIS